MAKTALFGAAGAAGNSIAQALSAAGQPYRVVGRRLDALQRSFGSDPLAEAVAWNPDDPASVRQACRGVDTLIYLVGVPYNHFELHPQLMRKTLAGALAEGVQRILLIGTVYAYGLPQSNAVTEQHPRAPHTRKGSMRKEQEDILLEAHQSGKIQVAILRLPDFYGPGVELSMLHGLFVAAAAGKTADLIGPIDRPHQFVYLPDVGPVALALAAKPEAYGTWWNFAGSGTTTQQAILDQVNTLAGHPVKTRVAGKTMLRIGGLFQPFMRELVEMHYLFTQPVLLDDSALQHLLGDLPRTPYAKGIAAAYRYEVEKQRAASTR